MDAEVTGLYRKDDWAFAIVGAGQRLAMSRDDYVAGDYQPPFGDLIGEADFHEQMLSGNSPS